MNIEKKSTILWLMAVMAAVMAFGNEPTGDTYAIVVGGISKDPNDRLMRDRVVSDLRRYLVERASVRSDRIIMLAADASPTGVSAAEGIQAAIAAVASTADSTDRFVFYFIGQANVVGEALRFNVPGPDVTHATLAAWLAGVKAGTQLVVLDCPCAGMAAKALTHPGRIVVLASTKEQPHAPQFGQHFVPALSQAETDTDHDGRISVLEAFTATARRIEQWYRERQLLPTETPCLEDNGDGRPAERPWRYEQDGGDGKLAAAMVLAPKV